MDKVRRAQKKADDLEKAEINYGTNQPTLKVFRRVSCIFLLSEILTNIFIFFYTVAS